VIDMTDASLWQDVDAAIVGAGPAGLAAAVYLARFLRTVVVFDAQDGRARLIPKTRNCPGFPDGISGEELVSRLKAQAGQYGAHIVEDRIEAIERCGDGFILSTAAGNLQASCVILATGIVDISPDIGSLREAISSGILRLCPVCDAYEVAGKRIGVVGPDQQALKEALFLRHFSPHVSMLANYPDDLCDCTRKSAALAGITIWDTVDDLVPQDAGIDVVMADGSPTRQIDVLYPAMGCDVRSELAVSLGADCDEEGYVLVGEHLQTSLPGLYAIGDVAKALNQIAVGFGHAALAATHIHNTLQPARQSMGRPPVTS
jgi:thioredoxin reductase (NADPH)